MNPHYIIDGYNLIYNVPRFRRALDSGLDQARNIAIAFIRAYQSGRKLKVTIVFDGEQVGYVDLPTPSTNWLQVIFSKPPEKADPVIKRLIQKVKNKKSLIVVSDDSDLVQFGKKMGADTMSPVDFYHRASKHPHQTQMDQKYNSDLLPDEVLEWLKLFGEDKK